MLEDYVYLLALKSRKDFLIKSLKNESLNDYSVEYTEELISVYEKLDKTNEKGRTKK